MRSVIFCQIAGVAGGADEPVPFAQAQQQVVGAKLPVSGSARSPQAIALPAPAAIDAIAIETFWKPCRDVFRKLKWSGISAFTSKIGSVKAKVLPFCGSLSTDKRAEIDAHQLARDVEPEPEAVLLRLVLRELLEAVEDQLDVLGRDAGPAVGDPDRDVAVIGIVARPDFDLAVLAGVFAGIGAEIDDHPADAFGVGEDVRNLVGNRELDLDLMRRRPLLERRLAPAR